MAIILLGVGPYMTAMVADSVRNTPDNLVNSALTLGASRFQVIRSVVFHSAAPQIWHSARISMGITWTYILTAEIVGTEYGLGRLMIRAERFIRTDEILATIIVLR